MLPGVDPDSDADPDPPIFIIDFQDANKKTNLKKSFSAYYFLKVLLHHYSEIKRQKKVTKQYGRNQCFSYYFCLMIEGSGSGSRRIKNMWIRLIRIRNTAARVPWSGTVGASSPASVVCACASRPPGWRCSG
jgi:hypothetical protein